MIACSWVSKTSNLSRMWTWNSFWVSRFCSLLAVSLSLRLLPEMMILLMMRWNLLGEFHRLCSGFPAERSEPWVYLRWCGLSGRSGSETWWSPLKVRRKGDGYMRCGGCRSCRMQGLCRYRLCLDSGVEAIVICKTRRSGTRHRSDDVVAGGLKNEVKAGRIESQWRSSLLCIHNWSWLKTADSQNGI